MEAPGMKRTAGRRMGWAREISTEDDASSLRGWIRLGDGGEERLSVGVVRPGEDFSCGACFHEVTQVHDRSVLSYLADYRQVVRNKQIGQAAALLQIGQ